MRWYAVGRSVPSGACPSGRRFPAPLRLLPFGSVSPAASVAPRRSAGRFRPCRAVGGRGVGGGGCEPRSQAEGNRGAKTGYSVARS